MNLKDLRESIRVENERLRLRATLKDKLHVVQYFVEQFNAEPHHTKYADWAMAHMFEAIAAYDELYEFEVLNSNSYTTGFAVNAFLFNTFKGE
jgi:hypothetical protein